MYKILIAKKNIKKKFYINIFKNVIFRDIYMYFIFDKNFIQKFLQRPSNRKKTRNVKIKNNFLENENFFFLTKNLIKISKKKPLKKKMKLLELFNQFWFLFYPKEYFYIRKKMKSNYKNISNHSINWDCLAKYKIITPITNMKKKKKEKKDKKYNVGLKYFYFFRKKKNAKKRKNIKCIL